MKRNFVLHFLPEWKVTNVDTIGYGFIAKNFLIDLIYGRHVIELTL